jgi:hypothetical protein
MAVLILVGTPKTLNIPYFAMGSSTARANTWKITKKEVTHTIGGNGTRWIDDEKRRSKILMIETRNYIPHKTAFYANWLVFSDEASADAFCQKFDWANNAKQIKNIEARLEEAATVSDAKVRSGSFDLIKAPAEQRRSIVQRFIKMDDEIRDLRERLEFLTIAETLKNDWAVILQKSGI